MFKSWKIFLKSKFRDRYAKNYNFLMFVPFVNYIVKQNYFGDSSESFILMFWYWELDDRETLVAFYRRMLTSIFIIFLEPVKKEEKAAAPAAAPAAKESAAPVKAKDKAKRAKKRVLHGQHEKRSRKIRTSVHFHRPRTLRLPRAPRYPRKSAPRANK